MCAVAMWMWMLPTCTATEVKYETGVYYGVPTPCDCMVLRYFT